jgi:hypothetical protein
MSRSFTIVSIQRVNGTKVNYDGGRFLSEAPSGAAQKAFTKAYHHVNASGPMSLKITMRETTQNSLHKEFKYRVSRKAQKTQVERNGVIVTYNFTTKIKSI